MRGRIRVLANNHLGDKLSLDASRSLVWLHIAQVHRMQREKACGPILDDQLRTLAGVLAEHLDAVRTEQLNGHLYGKDTA